ncbi:hypothetical protein LNKW23_32980 [Paralimibaculum aggregatum]|uniref:Fe2OG dioxygenase domain-containing protein n=1 Tax=Paralimibaculum aggregatum TaxID=3036245 RepID=A0ABQ6LP18_9RHOB|nr:TIGR02466 family protein [Limibaculum sp. NKW23]GMG84084.1 hypothetical protein LNKW23_32980 [Limibaculum sp. NKW23]
MAAQPQIELRNIFPTPIAIFHMPDAARLNDALEAAILAKEAETASVHHSNWGGWQSPHDLDVWGGPEAVAVIETAQQIAGKLTCDRQGRPVAPRWAMNAWANVNRQGQGNEFHTHPGAFWSATYYVRDGGVAADPSLGGEFEIADPRGIAPAMLAPQLTIATRGAGSMGVSETVRPVEGMLMLFPSWLSHGVRPYNGDRLRISIALNLTPMP